MNTSQQAFDEDMAALERVLLDLRRVNSADNEHQLARSGMTAQTANGLRIALDALDAALDSASDRARGRE